LPRLKLLADHFARRFEAAMGLQQQQYLIARRVDRA
jgi:hypothetical protein